MEHWQLLLGSQAAPSYAAAAWLFLRLLGLIYLAAFISLGTQIQGLIGSRGILPALEFLQERRKGRRHYFGIPTLCWLNVSDQALSWMCWVGAGAALLLILGVWPTGMLAVLWALYLSLFHVSRIFLGYQWDILLLETGLLAIFLPPPLEFVATLAHPAAPSIVARWLLWWLLFRLMFSSGMIKLRSGDLLWRRLTALCWHYETQPLPTPVAWQAHQLPVAFHKFSAVLVFGIEVLGPFLIFGPVPMRRLAAGLFILFMLLIQLTGNFGFFNLLGIALSVLLLDDALLLPLLGQVQARLTTSNGWPDWVLLPLALVILLLSLETVLRLFRIILSWPAWLERCPEWLRALHLVNSYGLFSVMTPDRPELIIEGSLDGRTWSAYEFKWKPGDVYRPLRFIAPHQPRLDWQMWFAALGYYQNNAWFECFLHRLLEGSPPVLRLLKSNPFPAKPPQFIRASVYDYRFTSRAERRKTAAWWQRERRGLYCPVIQLSSPTG